MRLFLIGAGAIAREHARGAAAVGIAEIHVADARPDVAAALAADFPGTTAHADVASMLAVPARDDDVAIVATPVFLHREHTLAALAGGRHVLCEKPFAMSDAQAAEMIRAARAAGRRVGCCSSRFVNTRLSAMLRDRIASGALGEVYQVVWRTRNRRGRAGVEYQPASTWFVDRSLSGGGTLMDWGPYDIAVLNELFAPSAVDVQLARVATPDVFAPNHPPKLDVEFHVAASMVWQTPRGAVPITFERASCTHGPGGSLFSVEGTRGAAVYEWANFGGTNRLTFHGESPDGTPTEEEFEEPLDDVHQRPLIGFAAAIRGEAGIGKPLVADARAGFNLAVLRAIYDVAETGRTKAVTADHIEGLTK